jgi:hypothetical protein
MIKEDERLPEDSSDTSSEREETLSADLHPEAPVQCATYQGDEDGVVCQRFPHMDFCLCGDPAPFAAVEVKPRLFLSDFGSAMQTRELLALGVTHVLNLSSREYTKRYHYFNYLTLDVLSSNEEDIKKNFRITNRFIARALLEGGAVLIHCRTGLEIGPCFALAFLIAHEKVPLKVGLEMLGRRMKLEIASHFLRQLESYDLEKLAFISIKYKAVP